MRTTCGALVCERRIGMKSMTRTAPLAVSNSDSRMSVPGR
jgi:hypothetical protein